MCIEMSAFEKLNPLSVSCNSWCCRHKSNYQRTPNSNRLRHKKQLVNRIELDISTAEDLLFPAVGQNFCEYGLRGQIIDFDAGIIFCRRTGKIVRRIRCDAVYKSKSYACEFRKPALCKIYQSDHREASEAAIPAAENVRSSRCCRLCYNFQSLRSR